MKADPQTFVPQFMIFLSYFFILPTPVYITMKISPDGTYVLVDDEIGDRNTQFSANIPSGVHRPSGVPVPVG
jgi:hypothetical protein